MRAARCDSEPAKKPRQRPRGGAEARIIPAGRQLLPTRCPSSPSRGRRWRGRTLAGCGAGWDSRVRQPGCQRGLRNEMAPREEFLSPGTPPLEPAAPSLAELEVPAPPGPAGLVAAPAAGQRCARVRRQDGSMTIMPLAPGEAPAPRSAWDPRAHCYVARFFGVVARIGRLARPGWVRALLVCARRRH